MLRSVGDRLLRLRLQRDEKILEIGFFLVGLLIFVLAINNLYITYTLKETKKDNTVSQEKLIYPTPSLTPSFFSNPTSTINLPTNTPIPIHTTTQSQSANTTLVKEYFIPMGTGTNQSSDWEDVAGTQTSADFGQYGNIKEIRFEASVSVPSSSQIVWVRLFNKTDKHPVWYSEVATKGETSAYLVSQPVVYDTGQKIYQVQIKSQLKGLTNLVQSRIHITLK